MHLSYSRVGFTLLKQVKSFLSKNVVEREALTRNISNIKPRLILTVIKDFGRFGTSVKKLVLYGLVVMLTMGAFPSFKFLPFSAEVFAQDKVVQNLNFGSFNQPVALPHLGYISSYFSMNHPGIDLAANLNTPINPVSAGFVEAVNYDYFGYGHHVIVSHPDGFKSLYGHMGKISVKVGQYVSLGTKLGEIGMTGHTSGPHTHLEITKYGAYIDPTTILPKISNLPTLNSTRAVGGNLPVSKKGTPELRKTLKPDFS